MNTTLAKRSQQPTVNNSAIDDIMARISIKGPAFSIIAQNDYSVYAEPRYYFGPVKISKIQIKLVDEFSRLVDLNNSDFSFTLRMTTIYSAT
jgi:hypothetical protein